MNQAQLLEEKRDFSEKDLIDLDWGKIPKHIAIVMDGNRRWARFHNLPINMGYIAGAEALTNIVRVASKLGVETITAYTFSTENWNRTQEEVDTLMELFQTYLVKQRLPMKADGVRFDAIGDISKLPSSLQDEIISTKEFTADCSTINLVLALNYGSRDEICRAIKKMFQDYQNNLLEKEIDEKIVSQYLDTSPYRDPDLLIRTSGEFRLSNFLLWQISYSEVCVSKAFWPDFSAQNLLEAILEYQNRIRRHGGA